MASSECLLPFPQQAELRRLSAKHAGLEQIPVARHPENAFDVGPGVDLIVIQRGRLKLPAQSVIERQVRTGLPRVLRIKGVFILVVALGEGNEVVPAGRLIERSRAGYRTDSPG